MRLSSRRTARRGASTVEAAIVIPIFLLMVLGMIDLSMAVTRYNTLSQAARYGARQVAVHGSTSVVTGSNDAKWTSAWGTTAIDQQADVTGVNEVDAVRPMLVVCPLNQTRVKVNWLDNGNAVGDRVRVTVTSSYQPLVTYIFGGTAISLSASSTMLISH